MPKQQLPSSRLRQKPPRNSSPFLAASSSPSTDSDSTDSEERDVEHLDSKNRRRVKNRLSARRFRVRKKEYVKQLEDELNSSKLLILSLQTELANLKKVMAASASSSSLSISTSKSHTASSRYPEFSSVQVPTSTEDSRSSRKIASAKSTKSLATKGKTSALLDNPLAESLPVLPSAELRGLQLHSSLEPSSSLSRSSPKNDQKPPLAPTSSLGLNQLPISDSKIQTSSGIPHHRSMTDPSSFVVVSHPSVSHSSSDVKSELSNLEESQDFDFSSAPNTTACTPSYCDDVQVDRLSYERASSLLNEKQLPQELQVESDSSSKFQNGIFDLPMETPGQTQQQLQQKQESGVDYFSLFGIQDNKAATKDQFRSISLDKSNPASNPATSAVTPAFAKETPSLSLPEGQEMRQEDWDKLWEEFIQQASPAISRPTTLPAAAAEPPGGTNFQYASSSTLTANHDLSSMISEPATSSFSSSVSLNMLPQSAYDIFSDQTRLEEDLTLEKLNLHSHDAHHGVRLRDEDVNGLEVQENRKRRKWNSTSEESDSMNTDGITSNVENPHHVRKTSFHNGKNFMRNEFQPSQNSHTNFNSSSSPSHVNSQFGRHPSNVEAQAAPTSSDSLSGVSTFSALYEVYSDPSASPSLSSSLSHNDRDQVSMENLSSEQLASAATLFRHLFSSFIESSSWTPTPTTTIGTPTWVGAT